MRNVLKPNALYFTDNGAIYHGRCCGMTAQASGRDISGQKVEEIDPVTAAAFKAEVGVEPSCESCGGQAS